MQENSEQWVIINKNTGTILYNAVYISENMAKRTIRNLNTTDKDEYVPIQLYRSLLLDIYYEEISGHYKHKEAVNAK